MRDLLDDANALVRELSLSSTATSLMAKVGRKSWETDEQTLERVVSEYIECKYRGTPIPGSVQDKDSFAIPGQCKG